MAEEISANVSLMTEIKAAIEENMPVYAECGGLMYLAKSIIQGEKHYPMIGVFDCDVEMTKKPQGIGYTIQQALPGNPFFPEGTMVRGHEFGKPPPMYKPSISGSFLSSIELMKTSFAPASSRASRFSCPNQRRWRFLTVI